MGGGYMPRAVQSVGGGRLTPHTTGAHYLAHEGRGDEVDVVGDGPMDQVVLVLVGEGGEVHHNSGQVDVLPLPAVGECCV